MTVQEHSHTAEVGALTVAYLESGAGSPLILIHGAESDRFQFTGLREHLGADIRAISYDQRDTGDTFGPDGPYSLADLAEDVVGLIHALGLEKATLLGTSFGGMIAQHVALNHPEAVDGLILVATTPSAALLAESTAPLVRLSEDERRLAMVDALLSPAGRDRDPELAARGRRVLARRTAEQSARRFAVMPEHETVERLGEVTARVLLIHGSDDPITPLSGAELMRGALRDAHLEVIEGGRHGIGTEFPDVVAGHVRSFIFSTTSAATTPDTEPNGTA
ncbi:alpha/beta fold hydrolase [Microbacterium tumbae]